MPFPLASMLTPYLLLLKLGCLASPAYRAGYAGSLRLAWRFVQRTWPKDWMADDGDCDGNFSASNYSFLDTDPDGECGGESFTVDAKFVAGCACSLVGTVCLNLGINVQKWGLTYEGRRPAHLRRPMVKNPRWMCGFMIFCVSNVGDFLGLSLAPQTVIMAVGTASIVSNMIFGRCALPAAPAPCASATQGRVS
eukprot:scaffold1877_cov67-Phaeocystis_antarctica.AAC.4